MQDIMAKLQSILSTPEGQSQLNSITSMLNTNNNQPQPQQTDFNNQFANNATNNQYQEQPQNQMPDLSAIQNILASFNQQQNQTNNQTNANMPVSNNANTNANANLNGLGDLGGLAGIDINMIMKLQQIMGSMKVSDKNSQLLLSLKPHFGEKRRKKVDQALNIMKLISVLPALKESGILGGLL
ncbi:MAG: hypothetical protein RSA79_00805 [Oscillospiraceae bacterium]